MKPAEFKRQLETVLHAASFDHQQVAILLVAIDACSGDPSLPVASDVVNAIAATLWSTVRVTDRIFRLDGDTLGVVLLAQSAARGRECARRCRQALATVDLNGETSRSWKVSFALAEWRNHCDEIAFLRAAMKKLNASRNQDREEIADAETGYA